jgi:hypothetical protein
MAYVDSAFYESWTGTTAPEDFAVLANRASDVIDLLTRYKAREFDTLTELQQEQIQKATCSQVDFFVEFGLNSVQGGGESWTVGKVSVGASSGKYGEYTAKGISPNAVAYLEQSGLLYRGVMVI